MLSEFAGQYGYQLFVIEKERYQDRIISSTYIKEVLRDGDVEKAAKMLGYAYAVDGVVEHGKRLGRTLGFPTVNLHWPEDKIVPPKGVYFSRVRVDGAVYYGISNVGIKPTYRMNSAFWWKASYSAMKGTPTAKRSWWSF